MGQVFLARDTRLDRLVALKFLQELEGVDLDSQRERFAVEAKAVARLTHPNVVALYRTGEVARRPFLVSEYVAGESLDRLPKPMPPAEALALALDLCRGLAHAHRHGVLHRDLKPANAIRCKDGTAKLLDFGLAKLSAHSLDAGIGSAASAGSARPAAVAPAPSGRSTWNSST